MTEWPSPPDAIDPERGDWIRAQSAPVLRRLVRVGAPEVRAAALKSLAQLRQK